MTTRFADHLLTGNHAGRPVATDVPAGTLYSCTTHSLIYQSNGATWSTYATLGGTAPNAEDVPFTPAGTIAATDVQAAVEEVAAEAGGGGGAGGMLALKLVEGANPIANSGGQYEAASEARFFFLNLEGPMLVRGATFYNSEDDSGAMTWGLFDASADATAATKLAGGSAALGSGYGMKTCAATGAPVAVPAGAYILMFQWPAANAPKIRYQGGFIGGYNQAGVKAAYTWDDTPDLTTGWTKAGEAFCVGLIGDLDDGGNQW